MLALTSQACNAENATQDAGADQSPAGGDHGMTTATEHKHTNRLIKATSPYLLQHAHNPVDWYEWGPEALEKAKSEDKPIFLSIGYSACHWCHVMERESFENEEVAALMNQHYVCIKVDREERPDLDDIYMTATQAISGSGGWPMSVWLTPDQKPFFAGTYFPPEDRYGRPGFKRLLISFAEAWKDERGKLDQDANKLTATIRRHLVVAPGSNMVPHTVVIDAAKRIAKAFDPVRGGMSGGGTNKFPPSMAMDIMLRAHHHTMITPGSSVRLPQGELLDLVELTLEKMAHGGIYDHLGGGIARYSTDVRWLAPHFEKMLYDQALVSGIYLDGFRMTRKPLYSRVAAEIFDYVIEDLQSPEGGFYSTRDADSEGEEGKFYVWSRDEVERILGDEAPLFCEYYDVSHAGNWEGHNILNVPRTVEIVARLQKLSVDEVETRLAASRKKLFEVRERRIKPHLDDKILASWNGLMIASMARGSRILEQPKYAEAAAKAADFILTRMVVNGQLQRTYRKGKTHTPGYLDDYAFMIEGLLNLYEATFQVRWLDQALKLNDVVQQHFRDTQHGGFFFTDDRAEPVLARAKEATDSAVPSGNSVHLMNLLRLSILLDRKDLEQDAEKLMRTFSRQLVQNPFRSERMLSAIDFYHRRPKEVAFVASDANDPRLKALIDAAWRTYMPNQVFAALTLGAPEANALEKKIPLLAGKKPLDGKPAAYVCKNFTCKAPTSDPKELAEQIGR
ncbi:MAG: thioredoxin domain-containing protein [Planctomycetota bacterium]|nr:thioredoxin domain-containing protein [Planctomycetota bacterium]